MCEIFEYSCSGCNYSVDSIEKQERGLWHGIELAPMICADCSELNGYVLLGEHLDGIFRDLKDHQTCNICQSKNLISWINHQCPKCSSLMIKGEHIGYTDG
jgi:hypothetical protein